MVRNPVAEEEVGGRVVGQASRVHAALADGRQPLVPKPVHFLRWEGRTKEGFTEEGKRLSHSFGEAGEGDNQSRLGNRNQVLEKKPGFKPLGQEYMEMVQDGVIAAQYMLGWQLQPEDAVLLAPAYTFLMSNRPVDYQFWLNAGGRGWWERLYQPLTHPYVLSRRWPLHDRNDAVWSDADEVETRQEALHRLTLGLIRRCRRQIYLGLSELGEQGYEQKGPLLQAIQRVLRRQGGRLGNW